MSIERCPDFGQILRILEKKAPDRPTLFEFFMDDPLYEHVAGSIKEKKDGYDGLRRQVKTFYKVGYDYCTIRANDYAFKAKEADEKSTYSINEGGLIKDRESFENFDWKNPEDFGCVPVEVAAEELHEGAKLIVCGPGGLLENTIDLVGYEDLCFMMYENPDLLTDITTHIGERLISYYKMFIHHPMVGAIISNDDWGFNHQTMLSPDALRRWVFPWHRKIVQMAHDHGKPCILHSCGYAKDIMEDIIYDMKFDGKHSFEDNIRPIEEAYEEYHGKIALLGGLDLDFVCRSKPEEIHERAGKMIERTSGRGGWALGTGNSVPAYVPWENYFAMTSAATGLSYDQVMAR